MTDAAARLLRLLDDRTLVDAVLGDHPANDRMTAPREACLVHGCGLLAETLVLLGGGAPVLLSCGGEPLHAAVRHAGGYLDADGWSDEATLRARWAAIVASDPAAIRVEPYGAAGEGWFRAADPELDARIEQLADELIRRDPALVGALRAAI